MPKRLRGKYFLSATVTGNGNAQTTAHTLGRVPTVTTVIVGDTPNSAVVVTEGTHTSTGFVVTATTGTKYKIYGEV
jgi:hypothetical protein